MKSEILNARIGSAYLGLTYGYLTAIIGVEFGSSSQGFGTHDLRYEKYGIHYLTKILEVVGVDCWENLKGEYCRIERVDGCFGRKIVAIGHIIEDRWFNPEEEARVK